MAKNGSRVQIPRHGKITVLTAENPHRGKLAARTFNLYQDGQTVEAFRAECRKRRCDAGYLKSDIKRGYIAVNVPKEGKAKQ